MNISKALEEIKRADHLIFVSLKYTRTVDVIKSIIERMITAIDCLMDALFEHAQKKKKIKVLPTAPVVKAETIKKLYSDDVRIVEMMDFYLSLRKISKAHFTKREEYRRHVTMIATVEGDIVNVDIDTLKEYFEKLKTFMRFVKRMINEEKEEQA